MDISNKENCLVFAAVVYSIPINAYGLWGIYWYILQLCVARRSIIGNSPNETEG
jgi:hypothetical protein